MPFSESQELVQTFATRQPDNPEVASIERRDTADPLLLDHPEQGSIRQIHRQIAVLAPPGRHRFQGGSIELREVHPTERHSGQKPRFQIRRNQVRWQTSINTGLKEPSAGFMVLIPAIKQATSRLVFSKVALSFLLVLIPQLLPQQGGMVPAPAGGADVWHDAGEAAHQAEAFRQGCRASGLLLQQGKASLDYITLAESEGQAEVVEPGLADVIEAHAEPCGPEYARWK